MLPIATYHVSTLLLLCILIAAAIVDLFRHRVPNLLSLGGLALGLALQFWVLGLDGLLDGLGGAAVGMGMLMPFYLGRGMGAGDVKLMGAVGAFVGFKFTLLAAGFSLGAGSLLGFSILLVRRGTGPFFKRYGRMAQCVAVTGKCAYEAPDEGEVAAVRFPYAVAIGVGTTATLWWMGTLDSFLSLAKGMVL